MEPGLARFESEQPNVKYVHVNIDDKDLPKNKPLFDKYFKGQSIPYTVLVGTDDSAKLNWTGLKTYQQLVDEIAALEQSDGENK